MEISLNLTKDRADLFRDHLHAAIRRLSGHLLGPSGSARYKDGRYEIAMSIDLRVESFFTPLQLTMAIEPDGSLAKIALHPVSAEVEDPRWKVHASTFITEVLASTVAENLRKCFVRSTFCRTGSDLDGEYWLPGFRFAPAVPENDQSYLINAERYLYIDQEVDAIDQTHAIDIASERALQHAARLSLILDTALYKPSMGMRWFLESTEGGDLVSRLEHLGFKHDIPAKMPAKGIDSRRGRFDTSIFDEHQNSRGLLMCPKETRKILRGLDKSPPDVREAFDSCARLYQVSLIAGRGFPTVRLSYQVGAVEAITKCISGYTGFSDFVKKQLSLDDGADDFLNRLYGAIRSAHFHSGQFHLGEFRSRKFSWGIGNQDDHDNFETDLAASKLMRQSITNWVSRDIMPRGES